MVLDLLMKKYQEETVTCKIIFNKLLSSNGEVRKCPMVVQVLIHSTFPYGLTRVYSGVAVACRYNLKLTWTTVIV